MERNEKEPRDANRDPITGAPGAHPVGVGLGTAAGGMAAGAAAGAVGGPAGAVAGAVVGGIVGGLAGKAAGEALDPTAEDAYWRNNHKSQSHYDPAYTYDDYAPAYRTGYMNRARLGNATFDDVEDDLRANYERSKGRSRLEWEQAKDATRAAWDRIGSDRH